MSSRPWLLADLGGTYARFALADSHTRTLSNQVVLPTNSATTLVGLVDQYLKRQSEARPIAASIACAGPIVGDQCSLTNAQIQFSIEQTQEELGLDTLLVINDFAAVARAIPELRPEEIKQIGGG